VCEISDSTERFEEIGFGKVSLSLSLSLLLESCILIQVIVFRRFQLWFLPSCQERLVSF